MEILVVPSPLGEVIETATVSSAAKVLLKDAPASTDLPSTVALPPERVRV